MIALPPELKKLFLFGSGVGIQITGPKGAESLRVTAVSVRPAGVRLRGRLDIENFPNQPAGVWGTDYAAFLDKVGMHHVTATVLLPRQDVIVRPLPFPGVSDKDLGGAIQFQMEGLHPYKDEDVLTSWARLPGTSTVLVVITRRDTLERYTSLFSEAGIKVGGFTCSAAAIYGALRLYGKPLPAEILACDEEGNVTEVYGESPTRSLFTASLPMDAANAVKFAASELRIPVESLPEKPVMLARLFDAEHPLSYAAALAGACPRFAMLLNLLPVALRQTSSRIIWVPSAVLAALVLIVASGLAGLPVVANRRYVRSLDAEISKLTPRAAKAAEADQRTVLLQQRIRMLDDVRKRTRSDLDVLGELTRILPPSTWLNLTEISAKQVIIGGETDQAAPLLRIIDGSPLFENSEFNMTPLRGPGIEVFRIKTNREGVK